MTDETKHNHDECAECEFNAYQRERTASTILAALTPAGEGTAHDDTGRAILDAVDLGRVAYAVALTDALRAELAKVKP